MGEIKSTIDLALEKTRGMTLSDEEKKQIQDEKAQKRAGGLFLKYRERLLRLPDLETEASNADEVDPELVRAYISRQFLETLSPDMPDSVSLDDLPSLTPKMRNV